MAECKYGRRKQKKKFKWYKNNTWPAIVGLKMDEQVNKKGISVASRIEKGKKTALPL